jgi:hypothetical protein
VTWRPVLYLLILVVAGSASVWLFFDRRAESGRSSLEIVQEALDRDAAKPRFTGRIGAFEIHSSGEGEAEVQLVACPGGSGTSPVTDVRLLKESDLWSEGFGDNAVGWSCDGGDIRLINNEGGEGHAAQPDGALLSRAYFSSLPLPLARDVPADRLQETDVERHPALLESPIEGYPYGLASIAVIERLPSGRSPGIVVIVEYAPSAERVLELAKGLVH